ncbi:MAG: Flp pilus assembly protein CpaB [Pseudomonadota bacterium]
MRFGGLIAAICFAAIAAIVVLRMSGSGDSAPAQPVTGQPELKTINVFVAATPIAVGTTITQEMVATQPWPEHLSLPGFIKAEDGVGAVVGMVARGPFQQQEPLIAPKLANPNDPNFLAGDLPKGMRVVTIPIDEVDGIAGFVFPGDHVDVIYTHDIDKWESVPSSGNVDANGPQAPQKVKTTVSETLMTNVKVLAIDQRATGTNATDEKGNLIIPRSASLMVSQIDAQRVRLSLKTGTVSIVLRALADRESADPLLATTEADVTQTKPAEGSDAPVETVKILRGAPKQEREENSSSSSARGAATGYQPIKPNPVNPALVPVP